MPGAAPISRRGFDTAALVAQHPPRWRDRNKLVAAGVSSPPGAIHGGRLEFSRWPAAPLPPELGPLRENLLLVLPGFYDYVPLPELAGAVEWHVNFADPTLFVAYAGGLFAQDELQVAEHPALGALREALTADRLRATTLDPEGPTPILVTGVERRVAVATGPDAAAGRPRGLYGNEFAAAEAEVVRRAARVVDPPTITNLLAMSAPPGGHGMYRAEEVELIATTAFTGFRAAAAESELLRGGGGGRTRTVVHTGYWGCGAFGGNRVLMPLLQLVAAQLSGIDRLVFHTGAPGGERDLEQARSMLAELVAPGRIDTRALLAAITGKKLRWGWSDGT